MTACTEAEAKTKWCPFVRMLSHTSAYSKGEPTFEGGYSYNRSPDGGEGYVPVGAKCIASACMAWRWSPVENKGHRGCCGLAGKP